jgi:hypothetical protein
MIMNLIKKIFPPSEAVRTRHRQLDLAPKAKSRTETFTTPSKGVENITQVLLQATSSTTWTKQIKDFFPKTNCQDNEPNTHDTPKV